MPRNPGLSPRHRPGPPVTQQRSGKGLPLCQISQGQTVRAAVLSPSKPGGGGKAALR